MVEWMLFQRRGGIDAEGVAPGPGQKAGLDRLDKPHGGLAGHRTGWNRWRCHGEGVRWSRADAPGTVHGPVRKTISEHRLGSMSWTACDRPAVRLTIHQSSQTFMVNALLSLGA